ncbi:GM19810 [Drosophila sechellia]|uniref:GM19810 n=1 Tax=Drosophila sechellia TaxID=7238 RepID=B4HPT2_DROSE|nr:GM19810 [Drosophila sechellia]
MANRRCDFRSFCGATERIRNAGEKCLEEPQWAGVSTPSVAITSVLTWHYPLLIPDFRPQPSPEPEPDPDPSPDFRPPQTPIFMAVDAAQLRWSAGGRIFPRAANLADSSIRIST